MKKLSYLIIVLFASIATVHAQTETYYFSKTLESSFEETTTKVKDLLKEQGFGVMTEIDMDKKLAEKLDNVDMKPYKILGVCNPKFAHQTVQAEENIGLFLPCKVVIKYVDEGKSEVVLMNPSHIMSMIENSTLNEIADQVTERFEQVMEEL